MAHDREPVRHGHGLFLVVRHVDERDADLLLDPFELQLHLLAQLEVERAERFVEQQHLGVVHQRPGERHALLLSARHLGGLAALEPDQVDQLHGVADALVDLALLDLLAAQTERDVLVHVQVWEQRVGLEHGVHVALVGRKRRSRPGRPDTRCRTWAPRSRRSSAGWWSSRNPRGRAWRRTRPPGCRATGRPPRPRRRRASRLGRGARRSPARPPPPLSSCANHVTAAVAGHAAP